MLFTKELIILSLFYYYYCISQSHKTMDLLFDPGTDHVARLFRRLIVTLAALHNSALSMTPKPDLMVRFYF